MSTRNGAHRAAATRADDRGDGSPPEYVGSAADAMASWSEIDLSVQSAGSGDDSIAPSADLPVEHSDPG